MNISNSIDDKFVIPSLKSKIATPDDVISLQPLTPGVYFDAKEIDLEYDNYIIFFSGGKDSLAVIKYLLDRGVPTSKIELWHHLVDGKEGSSLMDWLFMEDYCLKVAESLGVPLYFSWLKHGFEGEMLKNNSKSHPHIIQTPNGFIELPRNSAKLGTRLKFPQQSASLSTRWCSSSLKIDIGRRGITSQERFIGKRVLVLSGERRQESSNRSKYNQLEPHATDTTRKSKNPVKPRHVDVWRPVLHMSEEEIWGMLEDWRIIAPIPYRLGWPRSSCAKCIFSSDAIWATLEHFWPGSLDDVDIYESQFGNTISRNKITVKERAKLAKPFNIDDKEALQQAVNAAYELPVFLDSGQVWQLPAGAFKKEAAGAL